MVNEWDRISKIRESRTGITTYYLDGLKVSKEEVLAISESEMRHISIIEKGGTPSSIDTYKEKDLSDRIEMIRTKAQLKQK